MNLGDADTVAMLVVDGLSPYCEKIDVAGSVRRRKQEPKDIEVVCIPSDIKGIPDLFGGIMYVRNPAFCNVVNRWPKVKGEPTGRYTQRVLLNDDGSEFCKLDLFMCVQENYGLMYAIRTGPAEFSHYQIAKGALRAGYKIQGGMLTRHGEIVPVPDEPTLFRLLRMEYLDPEDRH